jgi:uncharacterized protein YsxB (DUF464 family)
MIRAEAEGCALRLRGHAGSGEPGHDLICAGVSALVLALREELLYLEGRGDLRLRSLRLEPGDAELLWEPAPGREEAAQTAFDTVLRGLRLLERLFGEHVQVTVPDMGKKLPCVRGAVSEAD